MQVWNCIMQRGRHLFILRRNAAKFSGPEVIWDGPKVFSGQTSPHFSLSSNSMWQRWKRPSRLLPTKSAKTSLCDGMGVAFVPIIFFFWLGCLWQPLEPYGKNFLILAYWFGTVPCFVVPRFMSPARAFYHHQWVRFGGTFMQVLFES